ncbi:MAG: hypothetical protein ACI8QZ_003630 [Chlamydiales bacterium]|jgi:hypothetical protein
MGLAFCATGCAGHRNLADPTVVLQTQGGRELGVSTDYGVVFLGQTARSGYVEVQSWFGDGPSIEPSVIEPVGGGIFTAETEIRLPQVTMTFQEPAAGAKVRVLGRTVEGGWTAESTVRTDPRVYGILIDVPVELNGNPDQVGAGVYWVDPTDSYKQRLIGLVSGHITLSSSEGDSNYLTVVGPQDLWRLVTHRRDLEKRRPWVYRDDIL